MHLLTLLGKNRFTLYDDFNRPDSFTPWSAESKKLPTGQTWVEANTGKWGIVSGKLKDVTPAGVDRCLVDAGIADCEAMCKFSDFSGNQRFVFRVSLNGQSEWIFGNVSSNRYGLAKRVVGVGITNVFLSMVSIVSGDIVSVRMNGSQIDCFVNGALIASTFDEFNKDATLHGLCCDNSTATFDDFAVYDL